MGQTWDSELLRGLPVAPRCLAAQVANGLGQSSPAVVDVVLMHLDALDAALALDVPGLLADQARWQDVRLRGAGVLLGPDEIARAVRTALAALLGEVDLAEVERLQVVAAQIDADVVPVRQAVELPHGPARDYLLAAMSGDRDAAIAVVREATFRDVEVADIMMDILQPALVEVGRLWEEGRISIDHGHLTTAITQVTLSMLYPRLQLDRTWSGHSIVATTVGFETHDIGIRMISDLLDHDGWRSVYLGADVPPADVLERVAQHHADVLAVSATMPGHVRGVRQLISMIRADARTAHVRVLVGGRPFTSNPDLARVVGADGWAPDAPSVLALCQTWAATLAEAV